MATEYMAIDYIPTEYMDVRALDVRGCRDMTMPQLGAALRDLVCDGVVYLDRRADAVLVQTSTAEWKGGYSRMSMLDNRHWRVEWKRDQDIEKNSG